MQGIMAQTSSQLTELLGPQVVQISFAVAILIVGWLVALIARVIVRGALKRTTLDNRLAGWILDEKTAKNIEVERWAAKAVYYVILLFAVVGFFNALNLTVISQPLTAFLNQVFEYIPQLIGAGILVLAAWLLASILRRIVRAALDMAKIDERLDGKAGLKKDRAPLSKTLADAVYWLVFLLFLPAILETLSLEGLLAPVQNLVDRILGFLPNVLAAGVILAVGWLIARIVQRIVTNLLAALGVDGLGERVGLSQALGTRQLSGLLGLIVYILILVPVLISSLNALALEAITGPASEMLARVMEAIPLVFAAALLLTLAYVVGRLVSTLVASLLAGAGFDNVLERIGLVKAGKTAKTDRTPSAIVGYLILVGIMLFASIEAAGLLGFESLAALVSGFVVFAGQVVLGLVVFGVGLYLANLASRTVLASSSAQAAFLAMVARVSIIILAGAIALRQMGLANEIIELAFGMLLGSVAIAVALAFGLGGRDVAAKQIEGWLASLKKS